MNKKGKKYAKDEVFLTALGKKIREERLKKNLTQTELAFLCNDIDYSQINRIELGKVNFTVTYLKIIATALQTTPKDFLDDIDFNPTSKNPHQ